MFYQGNDLKAETGVETVVLCKALCLQHPECVGWSWVSHEYNIVAARGNCHLKSKMVNRKELLGIVSGEVQYC